MNDELKEYKPLELDYNVKSAVGNLKTAYWSNDTEKYAKAFTEAEEIIINAICHYGYVVCKQPQGEWIQREEIFDDEETPRLVWGCKDCGFSLKSIHDKRNYCPNCGAKMKGDAE